MVATYAWDGTQELFIRLQRRQGISDDEDARC